MPEKKTVGPVDGEDLDRHLDRAEPLYDELVDWMDCVTEETFDPSEMNRMLSALDEADPDSAIDELDHMDVEASLAKFKREHAEYFPDEAASTSANSSAAPHAAKKPRSMKRILRVVVPVAAVIAILVGGTIGAKAGGFNVFGVTIEWSGGNLQIRSVDQEEDVGVVVLSEGDKIEFVNLQEALDRLAIIEQLAPTDFAGYQVQEVVALMEANELRIRATYERNGDFLTIKIRQIDNNVYSSPEKNEGDIPVYIKGDIKHYITSNYNRTKVTWLNGSWECTVAASITVEEMKNVINSIYK